LINVVFIVKHFMMAILVLLFSTDDSWKITLRQEYVSFSSGHIDVDGIFFVRFLSDLRQVMIVATPPFRLTQVTFAQPYKNTD